MSVIWSGVTEEGAVVPVQVTDEGKVVAVGDGPEGEYLKLTGGNLTGDLTVNEKIELKTDGSITADGSIVAAGSVDTETYFWSRNASSESAGLYLYNYDGNASRDDGAIFITPTTGGTFTAQINYDGSAKFAGNVEANRFDANWFNATSPVSGASYGNKCNIKAAPAGNAIAIRDNSDSGTVNASINGNGSATFSGDVVIGSRGSKWLIRESNGVAMLIEQTLRRPRIEKVRDLPNELDLIEQALSEVMDKLKMVPPAGWPVWNGSDNA